MRRPDPRDILIGYLDGGKRAVTLADFQDLQEREWLKIKARKVKRAAADRPSASKGGKGER